MITIQETDLKERGHQAILKAKRLHRPILLSDVHKLNTVDPFTFFKSAKERYLGERFFWKDPQDEIILVGFGIAKQIQSDRAQDRFVLVEKEWKEFLEESLVFNPYRENGIGPVMFGGFSFDPYKEKTELWSQFADSLFHLPKFLFSVVNGQSFITTNIVCSEHDNESLFDKLILERNLLLNLFKQNDDSETASLLETTEIEPEQWKRSVDEVVEDLKTGPLKKVVLARELRLKFDREVATESVLDHLLKMQHNSFIFAFESNGDCFIGASPERLVKKQGESVFSTCLAGSIPRGRTEEEDVELGNQLLNDQKNLIEHGYVVEMIKEAMEESCQEVILPDKPQLMKIRDIQHLYTPVIGKCHKDTSLLLLVERLHPTPALGGLPSMEAVDKIRRVEALDRGLYAAPIGWLDYHSDGEFAVAIRSGLIQGKEASLFAGCGVVVDSNAESEYLETSLKFRPMLRALGGN